MPQKNKKGMVFMDIDLNALLLRSMQSSLQNAYLTMSTCISENFCQILPSFVQFQGITDNKYLCNRLTLIYH